MKLYLQCAKQQLPRSHQIVRRSRRKIHLFNHQHISNLMDSAGSNKTCCKKWELHQVLRLPRAVTAPATTSDTRTSPRVGPSADRTRMRHPHHIWNVIYSARSNRPPPQHHQIRGLPRKNPFPKIFENIFEYSWSVISNVGTIRESSHDPRMIRPWSQQSARGIFSRSPRTFPMEKYNVSNPLLHPNLDQALRMQTSPNTAPEHEKWNLNFTKYCACHEKGH